MTLQNIAWTYDGGIWTNSKGIPASGYTGVLLRHFEIDAGTEMRVRALGLKDVWIECTTATEVRNAQAIFGDLFRGVYLPDEPNNRDAAGNIVVSPERLAAIAAAVRSAGPVKLWLNVIARSDALAHVRAVAPDVLTCALYLNCDGKCGFCNSVDDLRVYAKVLLDVFKAAGLDDGRHTLGAVMQAFQMKRCGRPAITADYLAQIWRVAHEVFGTRIGLVSGYAWKKDDDLDGFMPMNHPELWPALKGLADIIQRESIEPPPSEFPGGGGTQTEFHVVVPPGIKRVVIDLP